MSPSMPHSSPVASTCSRTSTMSKASSSSFWSERPTAPTPPPSQHDTPYHQLSIEQNPLNEMPAPRPNPEPTSRPNLPPSFPSETPSQKWTRGKGFWRSFAAICIPLLLSALEGSITNTALPTISEALNLGTKYSWAATAFLLASTIPQPLYGQLGDMWGRKYPMLAAVAVFAVGSGISGAASSSSVLIFGRVVQGLGTGGIDLYAEMILCDIVPMRKRGPYSAIKHLVFAAGMTLGPLLGGVFAERNWRWCFLVNIPVCVVAITIIYFWLVVGGGIEARDGNVRAELKKMDVVGTLLLTMAVILVLVPLSMAGALHPWGHPVIVTPLLLGLVSFVGFGFFQRSKYCVHPIMPPRVFSNRTTNIALALTTIHGFVTYGFQFYLPPFFQAVKGSSPTQSGIEVLPTTLVVVVFAAIGGPLLTFWGRYKHIHIIGFGAMMLGLCLCTLLRENTPVYGWIIIQFIVATGTGLVVSTMLPAVQAKLPEETTGQSSASWGFLRGTGSLFGVAIPGAVFNERFAACLPYIDSWDARTQLDHGQAYQRATSSFVSRFNESVQAQIVAAYTESLKCVWIVFAILVAIGFLMTWFEKQHKLSKELNSKFGLKGASPIPQPNIAVGNLVGNPVDEKRFEDVDLG